MNFLVAVIICALVLSFSYIIACFCTELETCVKKNTNKQRSDVRVLNRTICRTSRKNRFDTGLDSKISRRREEANKRRADFRVSSRAIYRTGRKNRPDIGLDSEMSELREEARNEKEKRILAEAKLASLKEYYEKAEDGPEIAQ
jgi:hypothetical protein